MAYGSVEGTMKKWLSWKQIPVIKTNSVMKTIFVTKKM